MNVRYMLLSVLAALCCAACDGETAPVGTASPETSVPPGSSEPAAPAAAEYAGTVVMLPAPPHSDDEPALPGLVLGLRTADGDYILTVGGRWLADREVVLGGETHLLEEGCKVRMTGVATSVTAAGEEYRELEIGAITDMEYCDAEIVACTGTAVMLPAPPHSDDEPALPGLVLGLRTADGDYILTVGGRWLTDCEVVLGGCALVLEPGDEVAVTGVVTEVEVAGVEYGELEIETIDRI